MDAAYASDRLAVLKAADVRYLKDGEAVFLAPDGKGAFHLSMSASPGDVLSLKAAKGGAELARDGLAFDALAFFSDAKRYPLSDRFDLVAGRMQIDRKAQGIRVVLYDQAREAAATFDGLNWFAPDESYRIDAAFEPARKRSRREIQTERGLWRTFYLAGHAVFQIEGAPVKLPLYATTDDPAKIDYLFVSFTDETTGDETYSVGRYLELREFGAFPPVRVEIDFNRAYNPYCARSPHFNCPLALVHIPSSLRAGERAPD